MDGPTIQQKVWYGYAQAAKRIGFAFSQYRPAAGQPFVGAATLRGTINAGLTPASTGFNFERPEGNKTFYWNLLADGAQLQVGDILVGPQTFVVAAMPALLPITAVLSNDLVTISRASGEVDSAGVVTAQPSQTGGGVPYFGLSATAGSTSETIIITNAPCALTALGARALAAKDGTPSSSPGPVRWKFLIGAGIIAKGEVKDRDILTDQFGNRYQVSQDYFGPLGYEIEAIRLEM